MTSHARESKMHGQNQRIILNNLNTSKQSQGDKKDNANQQLQQEDIKKKQMDVLDMKNITFKIKYV